MCLPIEANGKELHYMPPLSELLPQINSVFFQFSCWNEMKASLRFLSFGAHSPSQLSTWNIWTTRQISSTCAFFAECEEGIYQKHIYYNRPWEIWTPPFCSLSTPRSRRWSYHDGKLNYYCNSLACFQLQLYDICKGNSMICSDIWHKYHKWYFETVIRNFTSL